MRSLLALWAGANSWSRNVDGLAVVLEMLRREFEPLGDGTEVIDLPGWKTVGDDGVLEEVPLGRVLRVWKRADAPFQVLLLGHMDTVFPPEHSFQAVRLGQDKVLRGPGVCDAKGGLVAMLLALESLERELASSRLGWEVVVTPDEELGSPGSSRLLRSLVANKGAALVFEPAQPGGAAVAARKGSANYALVFEGRAAHAGRNPEQGRNAVHALAEVVSQLTGRVAAEGGIQLNVGRVLGGEALNVVPARAVAWLNVRTLERADAQWFGELLDATTTQIQRRSGVEVRVHRLSSRPPKPLRQEDLSILEGLARCALEGGRELTWRDTGGASDGNTVAAEGLPTVDGLGPEGGGIHTAGEFVKLGSVVDRAHMTARWLAGVGTGEFALPGRSP